MERSLKNKLIALRRAIHRHPELGNREFRTTAVLEKELRAAGVRTKRITKTGVIGILEGGSKGRCIALRGDIDALPLTERTGKPYASCVPGVMHACGHDANSTIVLGAAALLARRRKELKGTVKFILQPNEESSGGAGQMMKAGVLSNPKVDAIVGIHVYPWLPAGTAGFKYGYMMAGVDKFRIEIIGEGGHGAYPHKGKDAVVIASHVIQALQSVVSREVNPVEPVVVTVGKIEGGEKFNILPGSVRMTGTVRTLNERLRSDMPRLIERKVKAITRAFGADYRFEYINLGLPLRNSEKMIELCRKAAGLVPGMKQAVLEQPSMGGEDFSEYLREVPGCFVYLGCSPKGTAYAWHHEKFNIDEAALPMGAELLAETAAAYLK